MKNVLHVQTLTSFLHEQKEIVEKEFTLWIVVDFIKLKREDGKIMLVQCFEHVWWAGKNE